MVTADYWTERSTNRRRFLAGGAGVAIGGAALAAVGCGGDDAAKGTSPVATVSPAGAGSPAASATGAPASPTPKKGGEVTFGVGSNNQTLDPHISLSSLVSYYPYFSNLLVKHDTFKIEPLTGELVESWEQIDPMTLVMKARKGVTWHPNKPAGGRAFNAGDIKYNLERIAGKYDPSRLPLFLRASSLAGMERVDVIDETTARVVFSKPNATFLNGISDYRMWTIPKELVDKDPDFKDPKNFSGTGPFIIDSWDASTLVGHYSANPNYWKAGKPYLAGVSQVNVPDAAAQQAAFLSGKTSFFSAQSDQLRSTITRSRPDAKIVQWETPLWDYFRLHQDRSAFKDVRVRQALFKAIDYTGILDAQFGKGWWNYTGPLVSGFPGAPSSDDLAKKSPWNPATKQQDVTDAKQLMDSAGFPDGAISFKIVSSGAGGQASDYAIRIQDNLLKIWPKMKIEQAPSVDAAGFQRSLTTGDYDVIVYTSGAPPSLILECLLHYRSGGSRNYSKFSNAEIDRLIDSGYSDFDAASRNKTLGQLNQVLTDNIWVIPLAKARGSLAVQKEVQGFTGSGIGGFTSSLDAPFFVEQYWLA